jgi:tetratricopeptide (TPR) repeat protein
VGTLEAAWALRTESPERAEQEARRALVLLDRELGRDARGEVLRQAEDLRARCWVYMANFRRIRSDFHAAEHFLSLAEEHLQSGTHSPQERAYLLLIRAGLHGELRQFEPAFALMDQVIAIHRWARDQRKLAESLITKSYLLDMARELEASLECLVQAEGLLDPLEQPWVALAVKQSRARLLNEIGCTERAAELLPEVRQLAQQVGSRLDRLRVRWVEGLVATNLGCTEEAEAHLRSVRDEFIREGIAFDAALASLDLAVVLLSTGQLEETRELAQEMLPLFQSLDVHREAFAALILFHQTALNEQATANLVRDIAAYLKRTSRNPSLKYEKPS